MEKRFRKYWVIAVAALAIAVFMSLPRMIIIGYFKANSDSGLHIISWWDLRNKLLLSFLVGWAFLWLNVIGIDLLARFKSRAVANFTLRLSVNIMLLVCIKLVFDSLGIPEQSGVRFGRGASFLFDISLVIEAIVCVLACELYRLVSQHQQEQLRNEMLLKEHADATYEVLKNQVDPHFLFNSLNTVHAMIDHDVAGTKRFVTSMSTVYRYILNSSRRRVVAVGEEHAFATAYVGMLLIRHKGTLFVDIDLPDHYSQFLVPPVSLQMLIENAVKHNEASVSSPLTINIYWRSGCVVVANRIARRKVRTISTGTGLHNLNKRYQHLCGAGISISRKEDIFSVAIPLLQWNDGKVSLINNERP